MTLRVIRRSFMQGLGSFAMIELVGCAATRSPSVPATTAPVRKEPLAPAPATVSPPGDARAVCAPEAPPPPKVVDYTLKLPDRSATAITGSAFLKKSRGLGRAAFDAAVLAEVTAGNVPPYERKLLPISTRDDAGHVATFHVLCDYLAIGSDEDFIRMPMTPAAAQTIADLTDTSLPTTHLVDAIYRQAVCKLPPSYIDGGPTDDDMTDFAAHHKKLEIARKKTGQELGVLTAGDKKDIVLCNRLEKSANRVAIYGWHKNEDEVIQPLSLVHSMRYADYSHGVRLVDRRVDVNGEERSFVDLLHDPDLAALVSDEGPLHVDAYSKVLPPYDGPKTHKRAKK